MKTIRSYPTLRNNKKKLRAKTYTLTKRLQHLREASANARRTEERARDAGRSMPPGILCMVHRIERFLAKPRHKQSRHKADLLHKGMLYAMLGALVDAVVEKHANECVCDEAPLPPPVPDRIQWGDCGAHDSMRARIERPFMRCDVDPYLTPIYPNPLPVEPDAEVLP